MDAQYDELNTQKQELENEQAELEASLATLEDLGNQLDSKESELQSQPGSDERPDHSGGGHGGNAERRVRRDRSGLQ